MDAHARDQILGVRRNDDVADPFFASRCGQPHGQRFGNRLFTCRRTHQLRAPVLSGVRNQVRGTQQRIERASVSPPAFQMRVGHGTFANVGIVDVGDLQFTSAGRHQLLHLVEHGFVVHVDAGHSVVRFGKLRVSLRWPTMWPSRISATPKRSASGTSFSRIFAPVFAAGNFRHMPDAALDDVVAQDHANGATVGEVLGQSQGRLRCRPHPPDRCSPSA